MVRELREALDDHQFEVLYQPQVSLKSSVITGYEALLRWRHPLRGLIEPQDFMRSAELSGLIIPIGLQALDLICAQIAGWDDALNIAVNFSPRQLSTKNAAREILDTLRRSDTPHDKFIVEVTELGVVGRGAAATLHTLHDEGIRIALDDFGAGFASFAALSELPIDILKVDQTLTWALSESNHPRERAFIVMESIAEIAKKLGMESIAEGIETADQADAVVRAGYNTGQGYYFGKPLPTDAHITAM
ncbi:EAL domain-containing protein [Rhodococcus sp. IEGM 1379]|uniref:EAL domain-containing protein n=1 Tax=Rhodococcus sp. IEGM 1379 TaxID=3047086 RepID=UPI0024B6B83C|nr:EAL domain-containing protein [Rhodococcus sp. IEGM 1379]MDI9916255.1 EAL domain-containing protein [Rhodococcus sp. IEGM 1379]